jgi:hypothetical protein
MKNWLIAAITVLVSVSSTRSAHADDFNGGLQIPAVIGHWLEGNREAALLVVRQSVPPPDAKPGSSRGEVAALRNLGARIHYECYQRLALLYVKKAGEELRNAEVFAAAAVWENPYELAYWRDYIRIATEQRAVSARSRRQLSPDAIEELWSDLLRREVFYPDLGRKFEFTASDELRHVGNAMIRDLQGDIFDARRILASWIAEPRGRTRCVAATVLLELQLETDQYADATELASDFHRICTGAAQKILADRHKLFDLPPTVASNDIIPVADGLPRISLAIDVPSSRPDPMRIIDRILRDPSRPADWDELLDSAGTDVRVLRRFDQLVDRVSERYNGDPPPAIIRARAFRLIQTSAFEKARGELDKLIAADPKGADADVLIASVLIDTDANIEPSDSSKRLLDHAIAIDPRMAACINREELDFCLDRSRECTLAAVLCRDDTEVVYQIWSDGWTGRKTGPAQVRREVVRLLTRVELNATLAKQADEQLSIHLREVEQRVAASESRIEVILDVRLPQIMATVANKADKNEIDAAITKERLHFRREVQRQAADIELLKAIVEEARVSSAEAFRIAHEYTTNVTTLNVLRPEFRNILAKVPQESLEETKAQMKQFGETMAALSAKLEQGQTPDFVANIKVLQHLESSSWEQIIHAAAAVVDSLAEIATRPGKSILQIARLVRIASEFLVDRYNDLKSRSKL